MTANIMNDESYNSSSFSNYPKLPEKYRFLDWPGCKIYMVINGYENYYFPYLDDNNRSFFPRSLTKININKGYIKLSYYNFPTDNIYYRKTMRTVKDKIYSIVIEISNLGLSANWTLSFSKTINGYKVDIPEIINDHCQSVKSYYSNLK